MPLIIHLALSVSQPASRTHKSECYTGACSWLLHVMHIWYQWLESVKTSPLARNLPLANQHDTCTACLFRSCSNIAAPWALLIICWHRCCIFPHRTLDTALSNQLAKLWILAIISTKKWSLFSKRLTEHWFFIIFACQRHFFRNCAINLKVLLDRLYLRVKTIWMRF